MDNIIVNNNGGLSLSVCINGVPTCHDVSEFDDILTFAVTLPHETTSENGFIRVFCDDNGEVSYIPMEKADNLFTADVRASSLCPGTDGALLYYRMEFDTDKGHVWFSKDENGMSPVLKYRDENIHHFQFTVRDKNASASAPEWLYGGIIYHIFVDRFCRGEKTMEEQGAEYKLRDNAVFNPDWENGIPVHAKYPGGRVDNNEFFGGTLWGAAEKLPYLSDLGVSCIYLSPVFTAYSNHKYDTGDYETVDEMFGGNKAFEYFLKEAKKHNIHVICDGVFNHTGDDSRYFNRYGRYNCVGAYQSKHSRYYEWYRFKQYPDKYDCWWGVDVLPAVSSSNESYRNYICGKDGILHRWMSLGVDGWRLDVADELDNSFLYDLHRRVKSEKSDAMIYGEVWEDASYKIAYGARRKYFRGRQLDSVMNYPFRNGIIAFIRDRDARALADTFEILIRHYPASAVNTLMNSLGTHDTERILTVLAGESCSDLNNDELATVRMTKEERERGKKLLRLASLLQYTLPGVPCVYYGDEVGMEGYRDPFNRRPYPWDGRANSSLREWYRKLGSVRRCKAALADGTFSVLQKENGVFAFLRELPNQKLFICVNRSDKPYSLPDGVWQDCLTDEIIHCGGYLMPDCGIFLEKK